MTTSRSSLLFTLLWTAVSASPLTAPALTAQSGTVAGLVRDASTRRPIEGALVRLEGTSYGDVTRANGTFVILGAPPGTYAVSARRVGFATRIVSGVLIAVARTRTINFELRPAQNDTTELSEFVANFGDPRIDRMVASYGDDQLRTLPSLNLSGIFSIGGGFTELPRTTASTSIADYRRGVTSQMSIRGARPEETKYLLDGIDVSNPVFGSPPLLLDPLATASVTVSPGHSDAEEGGGVAGVVSQAMREGGDRIHGAFEYQTSAVAGTLGLHADGASRAFDARAFASGPAPFAGDKLRFMVAGQTAGDRLRVQRYVRPSNFDRLPLRAQDSIRRVEAAWKDWTALEDGSGAQLAAKLSYAVRPSVHLSLSTVLHNRTALDAEPGILTGDSVAYPSVRDDGHFVALRAEKRFAHSAFSLTGADVGGVRQSCSIWQGVCVADRIARKPQGKEIPFGGVPPNGMPYAVSGQYFGGEQYESHVVRADMSAQLTDHHQVRTGLSTTQHDLSYRDVQAYAWRQGALVGTSPLMGVTVKANDVYRAHPTQFSSYVQDAIEYDLLTIKLGARFDYMRSGGIAFVNPLDPTNGTTAYEVCEGKAPGLSETPFTYNNLSGIQACFASPDGAHGLQTLLDSAGRIAQSDDMRRARPRTAFSPRIALSFPLSETSGMFLDVGRYSRTPTYHDVYRNSGTGTHPGLGFDADGVCESFHVKLGTTECVPNLTLDRRVPEFVGNPDLAFELSTGWEAGFSTELKRAHSLEASVFSWSQSHLPALYQTNAKTDLDLTYGLVKGGNRTVLSLGSASS
ncbi:MAG TPA: TonB-dependent receptor, partial [Gemmatimonadaceae bacterium]|nr:TonB-dependent receptor [Gemmatimonadaceae bacterium]